MAKICACCKKKIGLAEGSYRLNHTAVHFCLGCSEEAREMLKPILDLPDKEKYGRLPEIKKDFAAALTSSSYGKGAKDALKEEFILIYKEKIKNPQAETRFFRADFKESSDVIMNAGERISGSGDIRRSNVIRLGEAEYMTVVFEQRFFRTDSYASLTVNLTCSGGVSAVTAIGAGGGNGIFNIDLGASADYVRDFWRDIENFSSAWMEKETEDTGEYFSFESAERKVGEGRLDAKRPKPERIGIFGGSFDPVHMGHKALAEAAVKEAELDLLMVIPARVQPFKRGTEVTDERHREAMVRLAFCGGTDGDGGQSASEGNKGRIKVSRYELDDTAALSYTVNTLNHVKEEHPDAEIFFISGTDSYLSMERWYKGREILENFSLIVCPRPGYKEEELEDAVKKYRERYGTETITLVSKTPDISSTDIRKRLAEGKPVSGTIPKAVERYIRENGLYR